jgi:hypothetical protein
MKDQFDWPGDKNRSEGLNLVVDDDKTFNKLVYKDGRDGFVL